MGIRQKETWSSGRCCFFKRNNLEESFILQVLSHALDRIMLGVFCLLLLAASIFFAMMNNGTCIHNGKVISTARCFGGKCS